METAFHAFTVLQGADQFGGRTCLRESELLDCQLIQIHFQVCIMLVAEMTDSVYC